MHISKFFEEDIRHIVSDGSVLWENLRGCSVLVTGATGSIGRIIVTVLGELNKSRGMNIKIFAAGRNLEKGRELEKIDGVTFLAADIREKISLSPINYIIHCAAVTDSAKMAADPVGLIDTELSGAKNVLEAARQDTLQGMVYTSSMEVYGLTDLDEVREADLGSLDLTSPRTSYPQSKRMVESMCNCYFSQFNVPVNIVRLAMTFGAGGGDISADNRVWAQFARCAASGNPIVLHTEGTSHRSFVYTSDAVRGIFLALLSPSRGQTYNISSVSMTIRELAQRTAKKFGVEFCVNPPADISKMGYAPAANWSLNADKIKTLGWRPLVTTVEEMFERTVGDAAVR